MDVPPADRHGLKTPRKEEAMERLGKLGGLVVIADQAPKTRNSLTKRLIGHMVTLFGRTREQPMSTTKHGMEYSTMPVDTDRLRFEPEALEMLRRVETGLRDHVNDRLREIMECYGRDVITREDVLQSLTKAWETIEEELAVKR
jgi:hypothetical protein